MNLNIACFLLHILGVITVFTIPLGGAPVPYLVCGIASALAMPLLWPRLIQLRLKDCWPMVLYLMFATAVTAFAAESPYVVRSIRGVIQLYYSVGVATCLYLLIFSIRREKMATFCLVFLMIMAVASLLEFLGPLRSVSDTFRQIASPNWGYSNDERDIAMHGAIRTKVFTPEPSGAAGAFFWVSMLFFWSANLNYRRLLMWLVAAAILLWTVRSPTFIPAILCSLVTILVLECIDRGGKLLSSRNMMFTGGLMGISVLILIAAYPIFEERFKSISSGEGSFTMRESGALQFAGEYVEKHPFVGTGVVGDLEMLSGELSEFFISLGLVRDIKFSNVTEDSQFSVSKSLTNNVAVHFVYFGGLCGLIAAALLLRATFIGRRGLWMLVLLQIFIFAMAGGGYNSAPIWCIGFSLVAVARLRFIALRNRDQAIRFLKLSEPQVGTVMLPGCEVPAASEHFVS
jgi:hypothetical protein